MCCCVETPPSRAALPLRGVSGAKVRYALERVMLTNMLKKNAVHVIVAGIFGPNVADERNMELQTG